MTSKLVVNEIAADTGISTITVGDNMSGVTFKTGTSNLHNVGIEIAGINVLGADTPIGAGATIYNSGDVIVGGAVTATAFSGSGASLTSIPAGQLTGTVADARISTLTASKLSGALPAISGASLTNLPAQATIANNADNRVITGGSGVNLNGEANLTFSGSTLKVNSTTGHSYLKLNSNDNYSGSIHFGDQSDDDAAQIWYDNYQGNGMYLRTSENTPMSFYTNGTQRLRIYNDGVVAIGQSSKSSTVGAGNLDIQGNATSCIIEMGNPFPTWQGGIVPNFRITSTNSGYSVDFDSVWGGDNLLHKHLSFAAGNTDIWDGTYNNRIARFDGNGRLFLNGTTISNTYDYLTVRKPASGFGELSMTVDANTSTNSAANAFIFTKSKHTYWNGYGFQSSHGHIGAIVGKRDSAGGDSDQEIRIEIGGTHINQSEEKTWNFKNNGDLEISDGNLKLASGHGIDFSATTNSSGSMTAELLDDYEEGVWTPTAVGFTISSTYSARYTRIGRICHINCYVRSASGSGTSTQPQIGGLPFTAGGGNTYSYGAGRIGNGGHNNAAYDIVFQVQTNSTNVKLYVGDGGINESMMSNTHVIFSLVYEVA